LEKKGRKKKKREETFSHGIGFRLVWRQRSEKVWGRWEERKEKKEKEKGGRGGKWERKEYFCSLTLTTYVLDDVLQERDGRTNMMA